MNLIAILTTLIISSILRFAFGFKVECQTNLIEYSCRCDNIEVPLEEDHVEFDLNYANVDNITDVSLSTGKRGFTAFPVEIFEFFRNVETLRFQSDIEQLSKDDWKDAKQLKSLALNFNDLSKFITFNGLKKLERLYLSYNKITNIRHDVFKDLDKLDTLDLASNQIHMIEPGAFDSLKHLRTMILSSNQLTNIRSGTFVGLEKLEFLYLDFNRIHTIEDEAFDVSNLRILKLSFNKLTTLSDYVFSKMPSLEQLDMKQNELKRIDPLLSLQNLTDINLFDNHIVNIDLTKFAKFRQLRSLDLSSNGFSFDSLEESSTEDNMSLVNLHLAYNGLTNLNLKKLSVFKGLRHLNIMQNNFTNYDSLNPGDIKKALPNLETIRFDATRTKCENVDLFKNQMKDLNITVLVGSFDCL